MRIALADPSRTTRLIVMRLLAARDHQVMAFADGRDALACLTSDAGVEALITSAELGALSGLELCWEARLLATPQRPLYVLLMSSNCDQRHLVEALDAGADDFIGKPPLPEELYARLRAAERIVSMQRELIRLATTDPLTGLWNRRAFLAKASEACSRATRQGPLSALILDLDNFKQINDTYGHAVGDEAIRVCARAATGSGAVIGRLGGDEFAMVLEQQKLSHALDIAEGWRMRLAEWPIKTGRGDIRLTCSIGLSEAEPDDDIDQILTRADMALYEAKIRGRNRVIAAGAGMFPPREHDLRRMSHLAALEPSIV